MKIGFDIVRFHSAQNKPIIQLHCRDQRQGVLRANGDINSQQVLHSLRSHRSARVRQVSELALAQHHIPDETRYGRH